MTEVALGWDVVSGASGYDIYVGLAPGGPYTYDGSPTYDTSPKDVGNVVLGTFNVEGAGPYYFVVKAYDSGHNVIATGDEVIYPIPQEGDPPVGTPVLTVS